MKVQTIGKIGSNDLSVDGMSRGCKPSCRTVIRYFHRRERHRKLHDWMVSVPGLRPYAQ